MFLFLDHVMCLIVAMALLFAFLDEVQSCQCPRDRGGQGKERQTLLDFEVMVSLDTSESGHRIPTFSCTLVLRHHGEVITVFAQSASLATRNIAAGCESRVYQSLARVGYSSLRIKDSRRRGTCRCHAIVVPWTWVTQDLVI
jgi:hypothetical protein